MKSKIFIGFQRRIKLIVFSFKEVFSMSSTGIKEKVYITNFKKHLHEKALFHKYLCSVHDMIFMDSHKEYFLY